MNLNLNLNETNCPVPTTPGIYYARAFYEGSPDAGHLYGPFSCKEKAEQCALVLAGRMGVIKVTVEGGS